MELQHLNLKIFTRDSEKFDPEALIAVFHDWIRHRTLPGFLIDVADYRHVPRGPGVMLIAREAQYNLDEADGRRGLRYNQKCALPGDNAARLGEAFRNTIRAALLLEEKFPGDGGLSFARNEFEISVQDRVLAPSTPETFEKARPELEAFLREALGTEAFELRHRVDPRRVFTVSVHLEEDADLEALAARCTEQTP